MTIKGLLKITSLLATGILSLFLTACFETSVVVKVNKDGTGLIHQREYKNTMGALDAFGGMLGADEGEKEDDDDQKDVEDISLNQGPSEEELREIAKTMGKGVALESFKKNKNKAGWPGYEAVYTFENVNDIRVEMKVPDPESAGMEDEGKVEEEKEFITFELADNVLSIKTPNPGEKKEEDAAVDENVAPDGAEDPFGDEAADAGMGGMALMGPMLKGARMGIFVQAGDEIAETNAHHHKGTLITLLKMDFGTLLSNANAMAQLEAVGDDREAAQKIADETDGVDIDAQKVITVTFK